MKWEDLWVSMCPIDRFDLYAGIDKDSNPLGSGSTDPGSPYSVRPFACNKLAIHVMLT